MLRLCLVAVLVGSFVTATAAVGADEELEISPPREQDGVLLHDVTSPYQKGRTEVRVLFPDQVGKDERFPTVYVLPVEAGRESRYGDGLKEIRTRNLHNTLRAVFVAPTFSQLPWYADHPTDLRIRQESYLLKVVIPMVEDTYRVRPDRSSRFVLGFSKSGWGAWSLLLRNPETFERAVAWDAPLMMTAPGKYGSGPIFGDQTNFDGYCLQTLVKRRVDMLKTRERLILTGYGNFRSEHVAMHALLEELRIPHTDRDGPQRKHDWHSGWVEEAVTLLLAKP